MRRAALFVEDAAHEAFITAVLRRMAKEHNQNVEVKLYSAEGGHGKVLSGLSRFLKDLKRDKDNLPDLIVVATDANCKGFLTRKQEICGSTDADDYRGFIVCAIPDPHIEQWMLLDSAAFKSVFGKGCTAPGQKCLRDIYKNLLFTAIKEAGISPALGGMEYAEDIVNAMDIQRMKQADDSLGKFLKDLENKFKEWKRGGVKQ